MIFPALLHTSPNVGISHCNRERSRCNEVGLNIVVLFDDVGVADKDEVENPGAHLFDTVNDCGSKDPTYLQRMG